MLSWKGGFMIALQWNTAIACKNVDRASNPDTITETDWLWSMIHLKCTPFTPKFRLDGCLVSGNNSRAGHQRTCIGDNSGFMEKRNQKTVLIHLHLPISQWAWHIVKKHYMSFTKPSLPQVLNFLACQSLRVGYSAVARFLGSWLDYLRWSELYHDMCKLGIPRLFWSPFCHWSS